MVRLIVLNEATALGFWLNILLDRPVTVLAVESTFPRMAKHLNALLTWAVNKGLAQRAIEGSPSLNRIRHYPLYVIFYAIFSRLESAIAEHFEFSLHSPALAEYDYVYRIATANHVHKKEVQVVILREYLANHGQESLKISGLSETTSFLFEACEGRRLPFRRHLALRKMASFVTLAGFLAISIIWACGRIRLWPPGEPETRLAFDWTNNQDLGLVDYLPSRTDALVVLRNRSDAGQVSAQDLRQATMNDGWFSPLSAYSAFKQALKDATRLASLSGKLEVGHYYLMVSQIFHRTRLRAFIERYKPQVFWGRDPYNPAHPIRRAEMHRINGRSVARLHGYGPMTFRVPTVSYVDYDEFYIFGSHLYDRYLKATWASDMQVIPVGSFTVTPDMIARMLQRSGAPHDIAIFSGYLADLNIIELKQFIHDVAQRFSDRRIILQIKPAHLESSTTQAFLEDIISVNENVIHIQKPWHEVALMVGYVFSEPSTVVLECLQLGIPAFMIDVLSEHEECYYRDFEGLCVRNGAEAESRIRQLETGESSFDRRKYISLVAQPDHEWAQVVAARLGFTGSGHAAAGDPHTEQTEHDNR